jgi:hypothetical protein
MSFILWVFFISVVLLAIRVAAAPIHGGRTLKTIFLPGVLVAIVLKSLACLLARAPLKAVNLPWRPGEPVVHESSPIHFLGPATLAALPVLASVGLVLFLRAALHPGFLGLHALPAIEANGSALDVWWGTSMGVLANAPLLLDQLRQGGWMVFLFLYLAVGVLTYASPAVGEWKVLAVLLGLIALPVAAIDWLGIRPGFLSRAWFIRRSFGPAVFEGLAVLMSCAWMALVAAGGARAASAFLRTALRSQEEGRHAHRPEKAPAIQ